MDKEKAIELARKLGKMTTDNGCSEAEAMAAAERLARIAAEHGFSRLDWSEDKVRSKVKSESTELDGHKKVPRYVFNLGQRLAKSFQCRLIWINSGRDGVDVFGDETNVVLFKFFLQEMLDTLPKIRWKAKTAMKVEGLNPTWKESWERGFIEAIGDRLDSIMGRIATEHADRCRSLILVTKDEVDKAVAIKYPKLSKIGSGPRRPIDDKAYNKGVQDGQTTKLQEMMQ